VGDLLWSGSNVRPSASAVWPILKPDLGAAVGTGSPFASILSSVNMRVVSVATTLAMYRDEWPGTATSMDDGLLAKLNALEMMYPSAVRTRPVVGPTPLRT